MLKAWNLGQVYGWYSERIFIIYLQTYMWPPIVKYQTKFTVIINFLHCFHWTEFDNNFKSRRCNLICVSLKQCTSPFKAWRSNPLHDLPIIT